MANNNNIFGVKIAEDSWNNAQIESVISKLHVPWIRLSKNLYTWIGTDTRFSYFKNRDYKIVSNLNYTTTTLPSPFPTGLSLTDYVHKLDSYLNKFKVNLVTVENEENSVAYHTGNAVDYIAQLSAAVDICYGRGVKVTNGGLVYRAVTFSVARSLVARGMITEANSFVNNTIPSGARTAVLNSGVNSGIDDTISKVDAYLAAYAAMPNLTYINIHLYEPLVLPFVGMIDETITTATVDAFKTIVEDIRYRTGNKKLICTEMGTINNSATLVAEVLQKSLDAGFKLVNWYSGDFGGVGGAVALHNSDGSLRETGNAFAQFMTSKYGT